MEIKNINPMDSIDNRTAHPTILLDETLHHISACLEEVTTYIEKDDYVTALSILNQTKNYIGCLRDGNRFMKSYNKLMEFENRS